MSFLVYKIEYNGLVYIGHTDNLKHRQINHRSSCFNEHLPEYNTKKYRLLRKAGIKRNEIILIPLVKDLDESESVYYEKIWYYKLNANLNSYIPGRTLEQYRIDNKEKNKEKKNEYSIQYYNDNIEQLKKKKKQKFNCFCGGKYTRTGKSKHYKTNKHLKKIK